MSVAGCLVPPRISAQVVEKQNHTFAQILGSPNHTPPPPTTRRRLEWEVSTFVARHNLRVLMLRFCVRVPSLRQKITPAEKNHRRQQRQQGRIWFAVALLACFYCRCLAGLWISSCHKYLYLLAPAARSVAYICITSPCLASHAWPPISRLFFGGPPLALLMPPSSPLQRIHTTYNTQTAIAFGLHHNGARNL